MNNEKEKSLPDINIRIRQLIDEFSNGNVAEFVKKTKIKTHQNLNRIFNIDSRNGKYPQPTSEILTCIKVNLPEVDFSWLLTGEGTMWNLEAKETIEKAILLLEKTKRSPSEISQNTDIMPYTIILDYIEKKKIPTLQHAYKLINYFESIDENIAPKITSTANIVSIPLEVWNVIKNQSDTLQKQSDSLIIKDQQINKVINMLETQIEESKKTLTQVAEAVTYAVAR